MNHPSAIKAEYWTRPAESVIRDLKTAPSGLSPAEAVRRKKKFGPNEIKKENGRGAAAILFAQFKSPFIIILIAASVISGILGEVISTVATIAIIAISAFISFFQEYRSEKTIEALRKKTALTAIVMRGGKRQEISAAGLVPGDIVLLDLGRVVPADLRLLEVDDLTIDEAMLTGESFPQEKTEKAIGPRGHLPSAMSNLAFSGTHVAQGSGMGVVVATGQATELGKTARLLARKTTETQFQKGIADFSVFLSKIIVIFSFLVFIFLAVLKGDWLASLLFSLAIAVGISPELLPIIITINLSSAARSLARKKVIVKKLMAIESLGNADVLCTDKTGTLTEGRIVLHEFFAIDGGAGEEIMAFAQLCNNFSVNKNISGNPFDRAIIAFARKRGLRSLTRGYRVIDDLPFDFVRRRMSVLAEKDGRRLVIAKGAVEEMLSICRYAKTGGGAEPIAGYREKIETRVREAEKNGYKVLLIATGENPRADKLRYEHENGMTLLGGLLFFDPPKKTAAGLLKRYAELGIAVKILTGDTETAARSFASRMSFPADRIVMGRDLEKMTDNELAAAVGEGDIFAKVTPEHKLKIVCALKKAGHAVAFLGDGVNDAPALREADIGISVDTATDVAREAADIILLKKSLSVLVGGIIQGRQTFGNTLKYIFTTISSNFGNMFSVTGAAFFLPYIPLLPAQVLLLNFLSDIPLLAIASDKLDPEYLKKPKHWDIGKIRKFMNYFGLVSSAFDFLAFGLMLFVFHAAAPLFRAGWFYESFLTEVLLVFVVRTKRWFYKSSPAKNLVAASVFATALALFFLYSPLRRVFGFDPIPLSANLAIIGISLLYFAVVEFGKKKFYEKYGI